MIQLIKDSAKAVGITAVITNSKEALETQLNSLTNNADSPLMLISWDIDTTLNFSVNSFLDNPDSKIVALLMKKASDLKKNTLEDASVEMGVLFQQFIQDLYNRLVPYMRTTTSPITNCGYKLVPRYGNGKHSGVLARWNMKIGLDVC